MVKPFLIAAVAATLIAGAADATIYVQTFGGTVTSGIDSANVVGGGDMAGKTYSAVFTFDSSLGLTNTTATSQQFVGGLPFSPTGPAVSATMSIGAFTYTIGGAYLSELYSRYENGSSNIFTRANQSLNVQMTMAANGVGNFGDPALDYSGPVTGSTGGTFYVDSTRLSLDISTYSVAAQADPTSEVPEPATWAMVITGFGAIGSAMRRRPQTALHLA